MNKGEPCFFYVMHDENRKKDRMAAICLKCHDTNKPEGELMFWNGGYGHSYDVICELCKHYIRKVNLNNGEKKDDKTGS
jgi:hypothetical protein